VRCEPYLDPPQTDGSEQELSKAGVDKVLTIEGEKIQVPVMPPSSLASFLDLCFFSTRSSTSAQKVSWKALRLVERRYGLLDPVLEPNEVEKSPDVWQLPLDVAHLVDAFFCELDLPDYISQANHSRFRSLRTARSMACVTF